MLSNRLFIIIGLAGIGWGTATAKAASLTVTPSVITNDFSGKITLTITGLTAGQTVRLDKYCDVNANGAIDSGEPLLLSHSLTDGQVPRIGGVRNINVPGDEDGATNGQIRAELAYPGIIPWVDYLAANYVWRASNPTNGLVLATQLQIVKQKVTAQRVAGRLTAAGTGLPLANALVVLAPQEGSPVNGCVADANGNYTLYGPPGGFDLIPIKPGFVADIGASQLLLPANQVISKNLALSAATRTISGQIQDSATGAGLGGVMVQGEANPSLFAGAFSDATGHYVLPVSGAQWNVTAERGQLAQQGYVGWDEGRIADTSTGNVANLNFAAPKASALIYGSLRDAQNQPLAGFSVDAGQGNVPKQNAYQAAGRALTTTTGFCLGVIAGDWQISADDNELYAQGFWSQITNVSIVNGQAVQANLTVQRLTARLLGRVVDDTGTPVANLNFGVSDYQNQSADFYPGTDGNGNFDIGVFAGTWHFQIDNDDAWQRGLAGQELAVTVSNGETQSNLTFVARRTTSRISGHVRDNLGNPLANVWVWAWSSLNGTNYTPGNSTDDNGYFQIGVFNAQWQVGANCEPITSRGLNCPPSQSVSITGANAVLDFTATGNAGPDVNYYVVGKYRSHLQTSTSAPTLYTNQPYMFFTFVYPASAQAVANATLTRPGGGSQSLLPTGYLDSLAIMESFATSAALNAAYPAGNYTLTMSGVHDGVHTATLALGADAYPTAPRLSNYAAAQAVNPTLDFTVSWDAFTGGTTNDFIQLRVFDAQTDLEVFATPPGMSTGALNGLARSAVIPRFTLAANRDYRALVLFAKITAFNFTSYPGVPGLTAFDTETRFVLHTINLPPGLSVVPAAVSSEYLDRIELAITGLANSQAVRVEKFLDANGNGIIDAGELLVQSFPLTDGQAMVIGGVRNVSVPGDDDGAANGMIRASLNFRQQSEANLGVGKFIYRVSPVGGGFTPLTALFTVTQPVYAQKITGKVTSGGVPVPYAFTFLTPGPDSSPVAMALTDASGNFTMNCATGTYAVATFKSGFLFNFAAAPTVSVKAGITTSQNLVLTAANRTISGRLTDIDDGAGIAGVQFFVKAANGLATLVFSDSNGNFTIPVSTSAGEWQIGASQIDSGLLGYAHLNDDPLINTSTGNVVGVSIQWPRTTALVYGYFRDDLGRAVVGVHVAMDLGLYQTVGVTDANGYYSLGIIAGNWWANTWDEDMAALNLLGQGTSVTAVAGQAVRADLTARRVTTHLRGRAIDDTGAPIANSGIELDGEGYWFSTPTDASGYFDVAVFGGQWHLNLSSETSNERNLARTTLFVTAVDGVDQNNLVYQARRATSQIIVSVVDPDGTPQPNVGIWANANLNGTEFNLWNETGGNGSGTLPVINGNWTVGLNSDDLIARGFAPAPNQNITIPSASQAVIFVVQPPTPPIVRLEPRGWERLATGEFRFSLGVTGTEGNPVTLQVSSDLSVWTDLQTTTDATVQFTDPAPGAPARFFRAVR